MIAKNAVTAGIAGILALRLTALAAETPSYGPELQGFRYPYPVEQFDFASQRQSMHMAYMDVRPKNNPNARTAVLGVLVRMGAQVREAVDDVDQMEPSGTVEVTGAPLKGTVIQGKEIPQLIDELPILAVAGALAGKPLHKKTHRE